MTAAMPVARVLVAQLAVTLLCVAGIFYDRTAGLSAAMGGALCLLPNALAAAILFRRRRARSVRDEQRRMQLAWTLRWLGALAGLGLIFGLHPEVRPVPLFAAYAAALAAPLIGRWIFR